MVIINVIIYLLLFFSSFVIAFPVNAEVGPWQNNTNLPYPLASHGSFESDGIISVTGGSAVIRQSHEESISSSILPSGILSNWTVSSTIPEKLIWHSNSYNDNFSYILGGYLDGVNGGPFTSVSSVYFGQIINGVVSSWQETSRLPLRLSQAASIISNDKIYFLGGTTASNSNNIFYSDKVYMAIINSDGSLGAWSETTPLPQAMYGLHVIETGGKIVAMGGRGEAGNGLNNVYEAIINPDGTLQAWTENDPLPDSIYRGSVVKTDSQVFILGGYVGDVISSAVHYAPILSTGNIGNWSQSEHDLPQEICCASAVIANNHVYITGGHNNTGYLDTVYYAPTINFSPTPTPDIPETSKIIFVPGVGGSWNTDAMLNCKIENYEGEWSLSPFAKSVYQPLIDALGENGLEVIPYYYDWRKQITSHTSGIDEFVTSNTLNDEKVHFLGHSMGGLLSRAYLEHKGEENRIDKLMTIASPHQGTVYAYATWAGGEIWNDNLIQRILMTIAKRRCIDIKASAPSTQNILPTFDYIHPPHSNDFLSVSNMINQNNWLPTGFSDPYYGVNMGTLSGVDRPTLSELQTSRPSALDQASGKWADGRPVNKIYSNDGDGAVLKSSAQLVGASNFEIPGSHESIVSGSLGIATVLGFFDRPLSVSRLAFTVQSNEPKTALVLISDTGKLQAGDEEPQDVLVMYDPPAGFHNFRFIPDGPNSSFSVIQFPENGSEIWNNFTVTGTRIKQVKVKTNL